MSEPNEKNIPAEKLVLVTFLPEGRTVEFEFGTMPYQHHGKPMSFLDVAENHDVFLDHACGGVCAHSAPRSAADSSTGGRPGAAASTIAATHAGRAYHHPVRRHHYSGPHHANS